MKIKAKNIMTKRVTSVTEDMSVRKLIRLLTEKKLHGVPVLDWKKRLVGVVTENDIISQDKNVHISPFIRTINIMLELMVPVEPKHKRFMKGGAPSEEELNPNYA